MSTDFDFLDEAKPVTQETLDATLQEAADLEAQLKALKTKKGIKVKEDKPTSTASLNLEEFLAEGHETTDLDKRVQNKLYEKALWDTLDIEAKSAIEMKMNWHIKDEWRDVSNADKIAIDTETYDPDLQTAGAGWARKSGHLCGVAIAAKFGDEIWSNYYPINHPNTNNWPKDKVIDYITDCFKKAKVRVFANAEYDMGWLNRYGVPLSAMIANGPIDDVLAKAVLVDETWLSHSLDNVGAFYVGERKDEKLLKDHQVRSTYGIQDIKKDLWKLPAGFVGAYAEQDAVLTLKADDALDPYIARHPLTGKSLEKVYDLERRLIPMLFEMHKRGVKIDVNRAEQIKVELEQKKQELQNKINEMGGLKININSGDDIGAACDNLGIPYPRTARTNKPSFTADFLDNSENEFLLMIREARKIGKVQSTFIDPIIDKCVDGRIYPQLNALKRVEDGLDGSSGTITGRLSCVKPNLQQVSSRDKVLAPIVRSIFLPDEGYLWGSFDYSQQEPRMTIHIAYLLKQLGVVGLDRVEEAVATFNANPRTDNHQMVADMVGIARRPAKTINLGLSYGMGALKLAKKLGLPTEIDERGKEVAGKEAKDLIKLFNQKLPYLKGFMNCAAQRAQNVGAVTTLLGRHSRYNLWTAKNWAKSQHLGMRVKEDIERDIAQLGEKSEWYGVPLVRAKTFSAMNHIVQGSSADQTKLAMLTVYENKIVLPYTQIHDSLECPIDKTRVHAHVKEIHDAMVHAMELCVPTVVDVELGETWGSVQKYEL